MQTTGQTITNGKYSIVILKWWEKDNFSTILSTSQKLDTVILTIDYFHKDKANNLKKWTNYWSIFHIIFIFACIIKT